MVNGKLESTLDSGDKLKTNNILIATGENQIFAFKFRF